jgi:hypothetical protein
VNERHPAATNAHRDEILARVITRQLRILRLQLELLEEARGSRAGAPALAPEEALTAPMTESQRGLWAVTRLGPDASAAYNETLILRLSGPLDVAALRRTWRRLVARHEALRTAFDIDGRQQRISREASIEVPLIDLAGAGTERHALALASAAARRPFDLVLGPLLRVALLRLAGERHLLLLVIHHLVCDGRSLGVLLAELPEIYRSERHGTPCALPAPVAFSAYGRLLADGAGRPSAQAAERFWLRKLARPPAPLELPIDRGRPPIQTYRGERARAELGAELGARLRAASTAAQATLFMTLLAAFEILVHHLTGRTDFVLGVHSAQRALDAGPHLFGLAIQTLPLRLEIDPRKSFREVVDATKSELLRAFEHDDVHIGRLIRKLKIGRDPSRPPLISVIFNLEAAAAELEWDDLRVAVVAEPSPPARYDAFWNLVVAGDALRVHCTYNADLFHASSVRSWLADYRAILEIAASEPAASIGAVLRRAAAERQRHARHEKSLRKERLQTARRKPVQL